MAEGTIGNYRLLAEIGRGGMGIVYKAEQTSLGRFVALKVLYPHLVTDPVILKRFNHEARAAALLNHPNIVQVYDVGVDQDQHYLAMEYVPGRTLASVLEDQGRLSPEDVLRIADQVAAALGAAHDAGITHRDIKPSNILIDEHGRAKVTDFGIAVAAGQGDLTDEGHLVGTARYMSPEQVRGEDLDIRSDLYSLGIVMYEMLVGSVPFDSKGSPLAVVAMHVGDAVPPMAGVPQMIEALVLTCLAKRPEDRPRTAAAFRRALREAASETQWRGQPLPPLESAGEGVPNGLSFRYDRSGVVRSAVDTVTISLAERLRGRLGRWLVARLGRRFKARRDSFKIKQVEVIQLRDDVACVEAKLEATRLDCETARGRYEAAEAEFFDREMSGGQATPRPGGSSPDADANGNNGPQERLADLKQQWQGLERQARALYDEAVRIRRDHDRAVDDLALLRQIRERLAEETGVARRNRTVVVLFLALVVGASGLWITVRLMLRSPATDANVPLVYGEFQATGSMQVARAEHAASLLDDGGVLVAGGIGADNGVLDSAEVYHRSTGEWRSAGKLRQARFGHTMTALADGRGVVVIGGARTLKGPDATDSVEVFAQGRFEEVCRLACARAHHQSVLLPDGRVLVTGGSDERGRPLDSAEIFTPATKSSRLLGARMKAARRDHTATVLPDGRVVVIGGNIRGVPLGSVEVFDPVTEQFEDVCALKDRRYGHSAAAIDGSRILVIGGQRKQERIDALESVELVDIERRASTKVGRLLGPRNAHTTVLLPGTPTLLIVGGDADERGTRSMCEFYSLGWTQGRPAGQLRHDRSKHTATLLADGSVVIAGGYGQETERPLGFTELYVKVPASVKSPLAPISSDNESGGSP